MLYQLLVWDLLQPFTLVLLLLWGAVLFLWWKGRQTRTRVVWIAVPLLGLTALSLPPVGYLALGSLEWQNPPLHDRPAKTDAIVVLASYVYPPDDVRQHAELDEDSLNRCLKALELYREGNPCPIVVTGGKPDPDAPGPSCAKAMRAFLLTVGVRESDILVEADSRTTYENALFTRTLLESFEAHRIVLITDATHLSRAAGCFRNQGLEVVPCGCQYRATRFEWSISSFLPKPSAIEQCQRACHEWLGTVWYRLRGRI